MKATDLMVGDWVICNYYSDKPFYMQFGVGDFQKLGFEFCDPIPLTREILEKNGFVANKHVYPYPYYEYINKEDKLKIGFAFPQGNKTSYKDPWVYIDSERVFIEHLPCMFVHQLQHALRLCEIDKTIEL